MQPRGRHPRAAGHLPGGRGDPRVGRGPVDRAPRARRAGAAPRCRPGGRGRCRRGRGRPLLMEHGPHHRRCRGARRRLGTEPGRGDRHARPSAACQRLRPDGGAGDPVGRRPGPASRRRHPGREVRAGRRRAGRGRVPVGGDLQLGPSRARVPPQPPLLGTGRLPGHRVGRALAPGRTAVVEREDARPLCGPGGRRAAHRRRRGGAHRRTATVRGAGPLPADPGRGSRRSSWPRTRTSTGWSSARPGASCSPSAAGCWPTR